jgi:hypothetical protein
MFYRCVDCTLSKTILETHGLRSDLRILVVTVGLAPCWGSEAIRLGAWPYRYATHRGNAGMTGVLFEICIVCVSVFVSI